LYWFLSVTLWQQIETITTNQNTMKTQTNIYVGTYGKYNEGNLNGEWITVQDYSDAEELMAAMAEIHEDEQDPEFMTQDSEGHLTDLIDESMSLEDWENIYEIIEAIENSYLDISAIEGYILNFGYDRNANIISEAESAYQGEFESDGDFAREMAESTGAIDSEVNWPHTCIDWEWAAREIMFDYFEANGHYFSSY
jgi:antirestriction protein